MARVENVSYQSSRTAWARIEREVERAAHPRVAELGAPGVQDEPLHDALIADRSGWSKASAQVS